MAMSQSHGSPKSTMQRSRSSGTLRNVGQARITSPMADGFDFPKLPPYLNVMKLTKNRKLTPSTGNLHGFMAEDYTQINWPLPKMFGKERYAYSMVDIDDPRYIKDCALMSQKLIRLHYDKQIVDQQWTRHYKALLDAEHRQATLPENAASKTTNDLKKEVDNCLKNCLELQKQKDEYEQLIAEVYAKGDAIKATIKKENDLEDLRTEMESGTRGKIAADSPFWKAKFNIRSQNAPSRSQGVNFDM